MKKLTGLDKHVPHQLDLLSRDGVECDSSQLPEAINDFVSSITASVKPLEVGVLSDLRSKLNIVPVVSEFDVYVKLIKLNVRKSSISDAINNRLLRKLADVIAGPICALINSSIRQGTVPEQWKFSRITPIPKCVPAVNVESDIRPIAVTCPISRIAESFMANFLIDTFIITWT